MEEDMRLPHRVRQRLYDWSWKYSGYEKHMNEVHPPIGFLDWGDVRFTIRTVTFSGGKIHAKATAGPQEAGGVKGHVTLTGTDGRPALYGIRSEDMGIKMAGSTWEFTWDVDVTRLKADDTPDAPLLADARAFRALGLAQLGVILRVRLVLGRLPALGVFRLGPLGALALGLLIRGTGDFLAAALGSLHPEVLRADARPLRLHALASRDGLAARSGHEVGAARTGLRSYRVHQRLVVRGVHPKTTAGQHLVPLELHRVTAPHRGLLSLGAGWVDVPAGLVALAPLVLGVPLPRQPVLLGLGLVALALFLGLRQRVLLLLLLLRHWRWLLPAALHLSTNTGGNTCPPHRRPS